MTEAITINKAGKEQVDIIMLLAEQVWPLTYKHLMAPDQLEYMMTLFYSRDSLLEQFEKNTFVIMSINEKPVGFAAYSPTADGSNYKLHKLYVLQSIQGRGLGKALVEFIIKEAKASRAAALELNVKRDNVARQFYERLGFEVIREEDIDIGNGYWMRDYVMRKVL